MIIPSLRCQFCNKKLVGKQSKFCSRICKNTAGNLVHKVYDVQREKGKIRRRKLLDQHGCQCAHCGYKKNTAALVFHHLRDKNFQIDIRNCSNRSWQALETEATKCIVLCHNCHTELHKPQCAFNLEEII